MPKTSPFIIVSLVSFILPSLLHRKLSPSKHPTYSIRAFFLKMGFLLTCFGFIPNISSWAIAMCNKTTLYEYGCCIITGKVWEREITYDTILEATAIQRRTIQAIFWGHELYSVLRVSMSSTRLHVKSYWLRGGRKKSCVYCLAVASSTPLIVAEPVPTIT